MPNRAAPPLIGAAALWWSSRPPELPLSLRRVALVSTQKNQHSALPVDRADLTASKVSDQDKRVTLKKEIRRLGRMAVGAGAFEEVTASLLALRLVGLSQLCALDEIRQLKQLKFLRKGTE